MTFSVLGDVNWLAIIVATIVYFGLGALWYSVLFSKPWTRAMDIDTSAGQQGASPLIYLFPLVTALVSTIVLAMLAYASGTDTVGEGIVLGLVTGIGLAAAAITVTGFFDPAKSEQRKFTLAAINGGYHVVGLVLAAVIIAAWA